MEKKERVITIIAAIVCIYLILVSITPLFGIEEPLLFLIIAIPTCAVLAIFVFKVRLEDVYRNK